MHKSKLRYKEMTFKSVFSLANPIKEGYTHLEFMSDRQNGIVDGVEANCIT